MTILEAVSKGRLFFDGGMGTELYKRGIKGDTALANLTSPEAVEEIHREYIQAGANIITANTFGAYKHKHDNAAEIIKAAMAIAKRACEGQTAYIALDLGATGLMLEPYGDVSIEECRDVYLTAARTGAECGADFILIETIMDLGELQAAVDAALETNLPIMATMSFNENGRTMYGASISDMVAALGHENIIALGMNCGFGPSAYMPLVETLVASTDKPIILQPNAGLPTLSDEGIPSYDLDPETFASLMSQAAGKGVKIFGGCCGTTPAHISAMVRGLL